MPTDSANGYQGDATGLVNNTAVSGLSGGGGGSEGEASSTSIPVSVNNSGGSVATTGDTTTQPADGAKTLDLF